MGVSSGCLWNRASRWEMAGFETVSVTLLGGDTRGMPRDGCEEMGIGKPCVYMGFRCCLGLLSIALYI